LRVETVRVDVGGLHHDRLLRLGQIADGDEGLRQSMDVEMASRLERIEGMLVALLERQTIKDWYSVEEFARLVGRAEFTAREWCRLGRVRAQKKASGRGKHAGWVISHQELERFQREGLLPPAHKSLA
jgi:Helix-turn-helix domain